MLFCAKWMDVPKIPNFQVPHFPAPEVLERESLKRFLIDSESCVESLDSKIGNRVTDLTQSVRLHDSWKRLHRLFTSF